MKIKIINMIFLYIYLYNFQKNLRQQFSAQIFQLEFQDLK